MADEEEDGAPAAGQRLSQARAGRPYPAGLTRIAQGIGRTRAASQAAARRWRLSSAAHGLMGTAGVSLPGPSGLAKLARNHGSMILVRIMFGFRMIAGCLADFQPERGSVRVLRGPLKICGHHN